FILFYFFFSSRRRHTISKHDWSSDVCSSDLTASPTFLQMLLGNVGEAVFENTVSIGQLKTGPKESLLSALRSYMASYGESQAARSEERRVGKGWGGRWWRVDRWDDREMELKA